jgi:hypothetical protein
MRIKSFTFGVCNPKINIAPAVLSSMNMGNENAQKNRHTAGPPFKDEPTLFGSV